MSSSAPRSPSLRTRVTLAAAVATTLVVVVVSVLAWTQIRSNAYHELDGKVDTLSAAMQPNLSSLNSATVQQNLADGSLATFRIAGVKVAGSDVEIPVQEEGTRDVAINGIDYRVKTNSVLDDTVFKGLVEVSVAVPLKPTTDRIGDQQQSLILIAAAAIVIAAALAWLLGALAVRPLRRLADRTGALPVDAGTGNQRRAGLADIRGAREAEDIAGAMDSLLGRVDAEHARTAEALATARDFASVSAHELRTPLTAMRTDLEVLDTMNPSETDRAQIISDLRNSHQRVVETLGALENLAQGSLGGAERTEVDLLDLVDRVVTEAARTHPAVRFTQTGQPPVLARVIESGIRMVLENAIKNAIRHGDATAIAVGTQYTGALSPSLRSTAGVVLWVDDDGTGVPPEQRLQLFERFARGDSKQSGSGLGLALVAQQAELHGGTAELADSPLGGTRLVLTISSNS